MHSHISRREKARQFNALIDQVLIAPTAQYQQQVLHLTKEVTLERLADRVRKRATIMAKQHRQESPKIMHARDTLILALFASTVPQGWSCAWSDGSSFKRGSQTRGGIGGILMSHSGETLVTISQAIDDQAAFDAEVTAIVTVMNCAIEHKQERLLVFTDNIGLAQLWREHRQDQRFAGIRKLSMKFKRFSLRGIPRQYNQPAHALARQACR